MFKWLLANKWAAREVGSPPHLLLLVGIGANLETVRTFLLSWNLRVQRGRALLKALRPYAISLVLQCTA